mgnify:CR=1 FL=1
MTSLGFVLISKPSCYKVVDFRFSFLSIIPIWKPRRGVSENVPGSDVAYYANLQGQGRPNALGTVHLQIVADEIDDRERNTRQTLGEFVRTLISLFTI